LGLEVNVVNFKDFLFYWHQDIEWFYSELKVPEASDVIGSYFMANGFSEGYFGIQVWWSGVNFQQHFWCQCRGSFVQLYDNEFKFGY
jgi:hypothetical protein